MKFCRCALVKLPIVVLILAVLTKGLEYVLLQHLPNFYVFKPSDLQAIVQESINSLEVDFTADQIMQTVHANLKKKYPDYIAELEPENWVFNNAGNAMGSMIILHASISEYLIFFGSAVGTEGHTGTHFADDYFTIVYGQQTAALPNATVAEKYLPGDVHHLPYGVNKQYSMTPGSFALELAQGYVPSMLPFGMIEMLTSTLDYKSFFKTVRLTAGQMIGNLLRGKF